MSLSNALVRITRASPKTPSIEFSQSLSMTPNCLLTWTLTQEIQWQQ